MVEILHQLIGSSSHYLQNLYIPGGAGFLPSTVSCHKFLNTLLTCLKLRSTKDLKFQRCFDVMLMHLFLNIHFQMLPILYDTNISG